MLRCLFVVALLIASSASADPRWHGGGHWQGQGGGHWHGDRGSDFGANVLGGVIGGFLGTVFGQPEPPPPPPPPEIPELEPWTPAWFAYCGGRYRTFSPQTGSYIGYDGERHFCK